MFHISVLVLILANQVVFVTGVECSKDPCNKCTISRTVNPNSLIWNKDGKTILSSTYQATNTCLPSAPNTKYATYCFEDPPKYIFILELLNPKEHAGSTFSDGSSGQTTTINLMVPNNLSSDNLTLNIPDKISGDIVNVSVSVPCSKPQPTFTWNFNSSKSTINYTIGSTQTSTDNTGCTPSLLKRESLLSFNLNVWDPDITKLDGDIDISVDVKFDKCDKISSSPVTVKYIAPGLLPGPHGCCCYCYCLVLLIIKVVLVVVTIILVIVHFCRREAKADGNFYWVITVGFILDGPVCFVLSIIQILYFEHIIACSKCMDKPGYDAAIAFDVCGFITSIVCIVFFWIRLKQRDQSKRVPVSTTEMNLNTEKEGNGTRPLPTPKIPKSS